MSNFFGELEAQLHAAAQSQALRRHRGRRTWRRIRSVAAVAPILAGAAVSVAVALVALLVIGHNHSVPRHAPTGPAGLPPRQELRYISEAFRQVANAPGSPCRSGPPYLPPTTHSTPGPALLSTVSVLRRPRTAHDRLPTNLQGLSGGSIYIDYVRRARVTDGVSYYVVPVTAMLFSNRRSSACYRAIRAALKTELPRIPTRLREPTLALEARLAAYQLRLERQDTHPGVCLIEANAQGQAASCGDTVDQLKRFGLISGPGVLAGIVPDGVASVMVEYPSVNGRPAQTATSNVTGNVFVTSIQRPRPHTLHLRPAMIWRSPDGRIIQKIPSLGPFSGLQTAGWCTEQARGRGHATFC